MAIKTASELAEKCKDVAQNYKTLYVMGCFGAPMTASNKDRYTRNHSYNRQTVRTVMIKSATADTFGFDCVNLIKALLWGWSGDKSANYGGAKYASNGVPDTNADGMIRLCKDVSTDFSDIQVGEAVWMSGHIGIYIGNGLAVESTPSWKNCVQITAVHNIGKKTGYNGRKWTKHGKLPFVTYDGKGETATETKTEEKTESNISTSPKVETTVNIKLTVLKRGAKGEQVKTLQRLLMALGYEMKDSGGKVYGVDGSFGGATCNAVCAFQKKNNLEVDGIVGKNTWNKLLKG